MTELKSFLLKQNYPENLIDGGIAKAMNLDKNTLRTIKNKTDDKVIPYVSTHNPKNPEIYKVIQFNLPILKENPKMNDILSNFKIIKSKRQPNNLKRLLTKAKFINSDHHIDICSHQLIPKYMIFPFYKIYSESVSFRCAKENYFINHRLPLSVPSKYA